MREGACANGDPAGTQLSAGVHREREGGDGESRRCRRGVGHHRDDDCHREEQSEQAHDGNASAPYAELMARKRTKIRRAATTVQESTAMHVIARSGFAVNGLLHIIMGSIAFAVAFGEQAEANHDGALAQLSAGPIGGLLLWATVIGLWGLAFFQLLTTALVRGTSKQAWSKRAKPGFRSLAYLGLGAIAFRFAVGLSPDGSEAQRISRDLLAVPGGQWGVAAIALGIFIAGIVFVAMGIRRKFLNDIDPPNKYVRRVARVAGVVGYISKGIALLTVGVLFGIAAVRNDADEAAGLDGALATLRELPSGNVVLSIVALGFILFGLYACIRARYEILERRGD